MFSLVLWYTFAPAKTHIVTTIGSASYLQSRHATERPLHGDWLPIQVPQTTHMEKGTRHGIHVRILRKTIIPDQVSFEAVKCLKAFKACWSVQCGGGGATERNFAVLLTTVENSLETKDGLKRTSKECDCLMFRHPYMMQRTAVLMVTVCKPDGLEDSLHRHLTWCQWKAGQGKTILTQRARHLRLKDTSLY